jgi:xylulokinase
LWQTTVKVLRQVTGALLADAGAIAGVAVASMAEAAVPLDAAGRPTYDVIAWFDRRTQPQVDWLEQTIGRDRLFAVTGLSLQPIFGLCKLLWLRDAEPEAFARTVRWLNVADYIAYRLCGVAATDYSLASRTLALDLSALRWAGDLLDAAGLSISLFAPLASSGTRLGPVQPDAAAAAGLPTDAWVAVGGHDHVCAALAAGVIEPGSVLQSLGTTEAHFLPVEQPVADPAFGRQGYNQGVHVVPGRYYVLGGLYTAGVCIDWLREILGGDLDYAALIAAAEGVPPGSFGATFLPHLRLANPPHDDPAGRGAFIGLTTDVKRDALARAVLEGLAYESRYSLQALAAYPGVAAPRQIYAVGGGTRNRLWMQIKASVLDQAIHVLDIAEVTALGAAVLGGLGAGIYPDVPSALAALHCERTPVQPVREHVPFYDACYRRLYQQIYPAVRDLHHTIHSLQRAHSL